MLFYNHKQEFIGINEEGLRILNYPTLEDLLEVCGDVADLFAKEPGYIHNFKSFGWIDFLLHADSDARSAIVHANGRTFSCTLEVSALYLIAEPSEPGYVIEFTHIQSISGDTIPSKSFVKTPHRPAPFETPRPDLSEASSLPNYAHITPTPLSEPGVLDIPSSFGESQSAETSIEELYPRFSEPPRSDESEKEYFTPEPSFEAEPLPEEFSPPQPPVRPSRNDALYTSDERAFLSTLKVNTSYRFDPSVAANELGLPVDLIQEFIGDFIQQAKEFRDDLFEAALKTDINNLRILSHKLKGVAANLRIEDAFEALSVVNTSNEPVEIEASLKYFYTIIDKLEGKEAVSIEEIQEEATAFEAPIPQTADEDIYDFGFKSDEPAQRVHDEYSETTLSAPKHGIDLSEDEPFVPEAFASAPYEESFKDDASFDLPYDEPFLKKAPLELSDDFSDLDKISEAPESTYLDEPVWEKEPSFDEIDDTPFFKETPLDDSFETPLAEDEIESEPRETLHYDKKFIAGQLGIEYDFFEELINEYKHEARRIGGEIVSAIGAFDTHAWKQSATELKGISDNLRLGEISEELAILTQTNDAQEANKASKRLNGYLEQL